MKKGILANLQLPVEEIMIYILATTAGTTARLKVQGELTVGGACKELEAAISGMRSKGATVVELDLSELSYMDSEGLGALLRVNRLKCSTCNERFFPTRNARCPKCDSLDVGPTGELKILRLSTKCFQLLKTTRTLALFELGDDTPGTVAP